MTDGEPAVEELVAQLAETNRQQAQQIETLTERVERLTDLLDTLATEAVTDDELMERVREGVERGTEEVLAGDADRGDRGGAGWSAAGRAFQ